MDQRVSEIKPFYKSKIFWLFVLMESFAIWDSDHSVGVFGIVMIILRVFTRQGLTWRLR